jgi:hypothetical protein
MYSVGSYSSWNNHPTLYIGDPGMIFQYICYFELRMHALRYFAGTMYGFQEVNSDVLHRVKNRA